MYVLYLVLYFMFSLELSVLGYIMFPGLLNYFNEAAMLPLMSRIIWFAVHPAMCPELGVGNLMCAANWWCNLGGMPEIDCGVYWS